VKYGVRKKIKTIELYYIYNIIILNLESKTTSEYILLFFYDLNKKWWIYVYVFIKLFIKININPFSRNYKMHSLSPSLETIKQKIDAMDEKHHLHIGSILRKNQQIKLNSNKTGTLVNLSIVPSETIDDILKYLNYVSDQEYSISKMESSAEELKQFITEKDHKDNYSILNNQPV